MNNPNELYNQATGIATVDAGPVLHVRAEGRSRDISMNTLDIGANTSDREIRDAVAQFMDINPSLLSNTVIERHENGNITLRPEAVFG